MNMRVIFWCLMVLALVLAACNSGAEETAAPASTIPATAVPDPTDPPPTATAVPEPTATAVPVIEPTESATDEPEPDSEEADLAEVGEAQTACDHPFLPMREGVVWNYQSAEGPLTWTVTEVTGDIDVATGRLRADVSGLELNYTWECTPEGMASFDFASLAYTPAGLDFTMEPVSMSGKFLLPADELQTGVTWDLVMDMTVGGNMPGAGAISGEATFNQVIEVVSTDPITYDGQTVDGLVLDRTMTIELTIAAGGTPVTTAPIVLSDTYTFGRGIGITSMEVSSPVGANILELVSYSIP